MPPPSSPLAHVRTLVQIPVFRGLSEAEAASMLEIADEAQAKRGDFLFKEGEIGDAVYVVLQGSVDILKQDKAGGQQSLAKLGDGSVFGEMSLISGNAPRSASAQAATDAKLLRIASDRFQKRLALNDIGALKIVHNLAQVMSRRLLLMDEKLVDLMDKGRKKEELADFQKILTNWSF